MYHARARINSTHMEEHEYTKALRESWEREYGKESKEDTQPRLRKDEEDCYTDE